MKREVKESKNFRAPPRDYPSSYLGLRYSWRLLPNNMQFLFLLLVLKLLNHLLKNISIQEIYALFVWYLQDLPPFAMILPSRILFFLTASLGGISQPPTYSPCSHRTTISKESPPSPLRCKSSSEQHNAIISLTFAPAQAFPFSFVAQLLWLKWK